jgi:hypothetical protein
MGGTMRLPSSTQVSISVDVDIPTLALAVSQLEYTAILRLVAYIDADVADSLFTNLLKKGVAEL